MRIGGVVVTKCEELIVLPRGGPGKDIPIKAKAVSIAEEFDRLVPLPIPPMLQTKDGNRPDYADKEYKKACKRRDEQRFAFMFLKSLEPSKIEWETVDMEKPNTWLGWEQELKDSGISEMEVNRIINAVMAANSLDEAKIKEAREAFLRGQGA